MSVLQAKNVVKKFGDFIAVNNISFDLDEGEILGVLGPNGAGKTTTIQILLGILTPTKGDITYFGKSLSNHREEIMENVNFSSTYTSLPWWLTVEENLYSISFFYNIKNRKQKVEEIISLFRLGDLKHQQMTELSAGQLTRVNLAKSFLNSPKVLLLDEPTASLDVEVAQYIRKFLLEQREKQKLSIIITSHNMAEVEELCDRVIVINNGKVVADDTPNQLRKSVTISHIELFIQKNIHKVISYCEEQKINFKVDGSTIYIDILNSQIPSFLQHLVGQGVVYNEISIEKPSLEDYFLQTINEEKINETI